MRVPISVPLSVYSWSEMKKYITPYIDDGKGLTFQKSSPADSSFDYGRNLIANNVAYGNGCSRIYTNFAERVDIFFSTVVNNTRTGTGSNTGISVSDLRKCCIVNYIAYSLNRQDRPTIHPKGMTRNKLMGFCQILQNRLSKLHECRYVKRAVYWYCLPVPP
jgi:hypothetical protein